MVWNVIMEDEEVQALSELKPVCPECNSKNVAWIFWGYPGNIKTIEEDLDKEEIILGGCLVSDHDPKWECNECHHRWGERDE